MSDNQGVGHYEDDDIQPIISASLWLRGTVGLFGLVVAFRTIGSMAAVEITAVALSLWSLLFIWPWLRRGG